MDPTASNGSTPATKTKLHVSINRLELEAKNLAEDLLSDGRDPKVTVQASYPYEIMLDDGTILEATLTAKLVVKRLVEEEEKPKQATFLNAAHA